MGEKHKNLSTAVFVAIRLRNCDDDNDNICQVHENKQMQIKDLERGDGEESKTFAFDHVFPPDTRQEQVYDVVGTRVLDNAFEGYNGCLFAYGQTGSGKTHTLVGGAGDNRGVIPRFCEQLFTTIEQKKYETATANPGEELIAEVEVEYMEIYGENVRDLLDPAGKGLRNKHKDLQIRVHPKRGPYVEGLHRVVATDATHIARLMAAGNAERTVAATDMNLTSSRSHAVFVITLHLNSLFNDGSGSRVTSSKLSMINLVDLAGSERVNQSGVTGKHLDEAIAINKSLTSLGMVIKALAEKRSQIPYRNSKLTLLLKESLGGNSKTVMLATVNPVAKYSSISIGTLRYAYDCKKIVNKAIVNEDPNAKKIKALQDEIAMLRKQLAQAAGLEDGDERAVYIQEAMQLNHQMMDGLQNVWETSHDNDQDKHAKDNLLVQMREMEQQDDFDPDSAEYIQLQAAVAELERKGAISNQKIVDKKATLEQLEEEREAVAKTSKEVEEAREQLEELRRESEEKMEQAQANINRSKWKEQNRLAVQQSQRPLILAKITKANEARRIELRNELTLLQDELRDKCGERDELKEMKRKREAMGISVTKEVSGPGNFSVRTGGGAAMRSHSANRPQSLHVSVANAVATPRGISSPQNTGDIIAADIKSIVDRMPGQPKRGTAAADWETKAFSRLKDKCTELSQQRHILTHKEKEVEELRAALVEELRNNNQQADELAAAQAALDSISPTKHLRINLDTQRTTSSSGSGQSSSSAGATSELATVTTGAASARSMASSSSKPSASGSGTSRSSIRSPTRDGPDDNQRSSWKLFERSRGRATSRSSSQPTPSSSGRDASAASRRSNSSSGKGFFGKRGRSPGTTTAVFDIDSPTSSPTAGKRKVLRGFFRRKKT